MTDYSEAPVKILLVEDDEVDIESIYRVFKKINLPVQLENVQNGFHALERLYTDYQHKILKLTPELIIMDINMPMMNGIEFLRRIRADQRLDESRVLILTTSDNIRDKLAIATLNVDGYIMKPVKQREIVDFLNKIGWNIME